MISKNINDYIASTSSMEWKPLVEAGVNTKGIYVKALRYDGERPPTFLLKFEPGASYPYHTHPAGEEAFVLEGEVTFEQTRLKAGDYLYTPPDFKHAVRSEKGCVVLFVVPKVVTIINKA